MCPCVCVCTKGIDMNSCWSSQVEFVFWDHFSLSPAVYSCVFSSFCSHIMTDFPLKRPLSLFKNEAFSSVVPCDAWASASIFSSLLNDRFMSAQMGSDGRRQTRHWLLSKHLAKQAQVLGPQCRENEKKPFSFILKWMIMRHWMIWGAQHSQYSRHGHQAAESEKEHEANQFSNWSLVGMLFRAPHIKTSVMFKLGSFYGGGRAQLQIQKINLGQISLLYSRVPHGWSSIFKLYLTQGGTDATGRRKWLVYSHCSEPPAASEPNQFDRADKLPHSDSCTTHPCFLHKVFNADLIWYEIGPAFTHTKTWLFALHFCQFSNLVSKLAAHSQLLSGWGEASLCHFFPSPHWGFIAVIVKEQTDDDLKWLVCLKEQIQIFVQLRFFNLHCT